MNIDNTVLVGTVLFSVGATHLYDQHKEKGGSYLDVAKDAPISTGLVLAGSALMAHMLFGRKS